MEDNDEKPTISTEFIADKNAIIKTSILSSLGTVLVVLAIFALWAQNPLKDIQTNKLTINTYDSQIKEIKESISVSRGELEKQVRKYIETNYGELSERDEKVDKLVIYFRQQDARLSNIEEALTKF
ncbi:MAG: hypothetical protein COA74_07995 [Gammaproteobacteria bacterium]|nr:MAG: hypothetical protein COA74_07995 [Gammaproteobacteria bacterium]